MERSKFLGALAVMCTAPLFGINKKENLKIGRPFIIRLSKTRSLNSNIFPYHEAKYLGYMDRDAIQEMVEHLLKSNQIKIWETTDDRYIVRNYMIKLFPQ